LRTDTSADASASQSTMADVADDLPF